MFIFIIINIINILAVIWIKVTKIPSSSANHREIETKAIGSKMLTFVDETRSLFMSLITTIVLFEWLALLMLIIREKYYTAPELLH